MNVLRLSLAMEASSATTKKKPHTYICTDFNCFPLANRSTNTDYSQRVG